MADQGATVTYANAAGDVARANASNAFGLNYKAFHDKQTMDHALRDMLYELLGPFHKDLQEEARGMGTPTFLQMAALAATEWGKSTPRERYANLEAISATWHPLEGVKGLIRRAREVITYSISTGHCIPDNIIVDKVLLVIVKS